MQEQASASPSLSAASFASLLAALTTPGPLEPLRSGGEDHAATWNGDELGDDIATLSYEQALRTHARYRREADSPLGEGSDARMRSEGAETFAAAKLGAGERVGRFSAGGGKGAAERSAAKRASSALEASRKSASITIRLSSAECAQLHERATEAGLTMSAYLRSCAFEAEALRAQVKDAVAQLRLGERTEERNPVQANHVSTPGWRARLFPRWKSQQSIAGG